MFSEFPRIWAEEPVLKLSKYLFEMDTRKFGRVRVKHFSVKAINEIIKMLPDYKDRPGRDVTVASTSMLCVGGEGNPIDGAQLMDAELEEFAEKFLEARPRLTVNDKAILELPRNEGEGHLDYCGRVIAADISSFHDRMADVVERSGVISAVKELNRLSDMVKQSSSLSAFSGLQTAADGIKSALQDVKQFSLLNSPTIKAFQEMDEQRQAFVEPSGISVQAKPFFERVEIPILPPNPIHKTNQKLENLTEQMEVFTGALAEHLSASAFALKDVAEQIEKGSKSTSRQNNIMIGLAVIAVIVSIVAAYLGYLGYTMAKSVSEKNTPPAVVLPLEAKPHPVPTAKTIPSIKPQSLVPKDKHGKVPVQ